MSTLLPLLEQALHTAKNHGAEQADVFIIKNHSRTALVRHGKAEGIKHAEGLSLSLRVFRGKRVASVSSNDLSFEALKQLAERACTMAAIVPESPYDGLADHPLIKQDNATLQALELNDPQALPDMGSLMQTAQHMEETALLSAGITNSNGASASAGQSEIALGTSTGFLGHYRRSHYSLGVSVVAGQAEAMERDYATANTLFQEDLPKAETLGRESAERALARLNPTRPQTGTYPVIFDRRITHSLLEHFANAINGAAIAKGASFLRDKIGQRLFSDSIHISDDPTRKRGLGSRPFDAEACAALPLSLVKNGILQHWLLDSRCGRELDLPSNNRAIRSVGNGPMPGVSNLFLHPGKLSPEELQADIKEGMLITEMMGNALNMLTGDYSRGASGFMIRNGKRAEPLSGVTVAGNLCDMFARLHPANDLHFENAINAPTIRIDHLTIAGR